MISETESTECSVCYSKHSSHSTHTPLGSGDQILCMLSETWYTDYFVRYPKQGQQSNLYDARKPPHRVLCALFQIKHTELYSAQCQEATKQSTLYGLFKVLCRLLCMVHTECILSLEVRLGQVRSKGSGGCLMVSQHQVQVIICTLYGPYRVLCRAL